MLVIRDFWKGSKNIQSAELIAVLKLIRYDLHTKPYTSHAYSDFERNLSIDG